MQKVSTIKINLFMKDFQGFPIKVTCSKLGRFTVPHIQAQIFSNFYLFIVVWTYHVKMAENMSTHKTTILMIK